MSTNSAATILASRNAGTADDLEDAALLLGVELPPVPAVAALTAPVSLEALVAVVAELQAVVVALDKRQRLLARLILKRP